MVVGYRGNEVFLKVRRNVILVFGLDSSKERFPLHGPVFVQPAQKSFIGYRCISSLHMSSMGNGSRDMKYLFSHCPKKL